VWPETTEHEDAIVEALVALLVADLRRYPLHVPDNDTSQASKTDVSEQGTTQEAA
jgi:hypothetical protein